MITSSENHSGTLVTGLITFTKHTMALHVDPPRGPVPKVLEVKGLDVKPRIYGKHELDKRWVLILQTLYVGDACNKAPLINQ